MQGPGGNEVTRGLGDVATVILIGHVVRSEMVDNQIVNVLDRLCFFMSRAVFGPDLRVVVFVLLQVAKIEGPDARLSLNQRFFARVSVLVAVAMRAINELLTGPVLVKARWRLERSDGVSLFLLLFEQSISLCSYIELRLLLAVLTNASFGEEINVIRSLETRRIARLLISCSIGVTVRLLAI